MNSREHHQTPRLFGLFGLALILLFSGLLLACSTDATDKLESQQRPTSQAKIPSDSWTDGLTLRAYRLDGSPEYRLEAQSMRHYPSQDGELEHSEFKQANMRVYAGPEGAWHIQAEGISQQPEQHKTLFHGKVKLTRQAIGNSPAIHIYSREMVADHDLQILQSAEPSRIESGPMRSQGVGLKLQLKRQKITLLSQVRSQYQTTTPP